MVSRSAIYFITLLLGVGLYSSDSSIIKFAAILPLAVNQIVFEAETRRREVEIPAELSEWEEVPQSLLIEFGDMVAEDVLSSLTEGKGLGWSVERTDQGAEVFVGENSIYRWSAAERLGE